MSGAVPSRGTSHEARSHRTRATVLHDVPLPGLTVVVFIVDAGQPAGAAGRYVHKHDGFQLMPMLFHSVQRLHPQARFTILTSPTTDVPAMGYPVEVFARPISPGPLLYERMRLYVAYLEQAPDDRTYLFLESDMLMLAALRVPVTEDWDAAIAYKYDGMLINSGMLLVRAHRRDAAIRFLRRTLEIYRERHFNDPHWGADQAAYRDTLGLSEPPMQASVVTVDGARVLLVLRDDYTKFSLKKMDTRLSMAMPTTWILHFSGRRKKNMPAFYRRHMGRGAVFQRILSFILGRRER